MVTPVDTFKLSTRNRQLQLYNGIVSYDVLAESSQFNVRSSVDFSQADRSLDVRFYSTPGSLHSFFVSAENVNTFLLFLHTLT